MVIRCCRYFLGCGDICKSGIFDIADAFFDAAVSARVGYSLLRMLFLMRWYLQEWDIRCCGCFFPATHV